MEELLIQDQVHKIILLITETQIQKPMIIVMAIIPVVQVF